MQDNNTNQTFGAITASLEQELERKQTQAIRDAFKAEPRPVPEGLIPTGLPLGHIAFMGDFDKREDT